MKTQEIPKNECLVCGDVVSPYYLRARRTPLCGRHYLEKKHSDRKRKGLK